MYVLVAGLRGFPDVQGGIETHCEELYPRLAASGVRVEVLARRGYPATSTPHEWRGVRIDPIWSPRHAQLETLLHSLWATLIAIWRRPDIYHLHAVGPGLMVPLARLFGLKVVVTHHGPDYDREKWSPFARAVLRLGERWGMRWSQARIVISNTIRDLVQQQHQRDSDLIPNGVPTVTPPTTTGALQELGVAPGRYVLQVSRLVPEKRQNDLVAAFKASGARAAGWHLLLVGSLQADGGDAYQQALQTEAGADSGVRLTGFRTGLELQELFAHAGLFVLPSSHEGLPIALLEALSYGRRVVASDIPANLEVGLAGEHYFPLGDTDQLRARIDAAVGTPWTEADAAAAVAETERFDWDDIAADTLSLYRRLIA